MSASKRLFIAASLLCSTIATAAEPATPPGPPNPPPEVARLLTSLVGSTKATLELTMGTQKHQVSGTRTCTRIAANRGVQCTAKMTIPGMGVMEEADLVSWDPYSNEVHLYSVTSMGDVHDHKGVMTGNALKLEYTGTREGKPYRETITLTLQTDGSTQMACEETLGGQPLSTIKGKLSKPQS